MTTDDAKSYLAKREVPQLFECLLTGLMYHRPKEHVDYLIDCLSKIKQQGLDHVRWNLFIEQRRKTPLPPITPPNGGRRSSRPGSKRSGKNMSREGSRDIRRTSPLPPIGGCEKASEDQLDIQNVPVIFMMGGPGSGKGTHCKRLIERYSKWVHLSMGDLIRDEVGRRGTSEEKWDMITDLLQKGEMAPEELTMELLTVNMKKHQGAAGFVIEGYPRTLQQVNEYEAKVGRVDLVFLLDCEEYYLQSRLLLRGESQRRMDDNLNAITARIAKFKNLTLPVVKHYDDRGQLVILDGDRDSDEIFYDLCSVFDSVFFQSGQETRHSPHPPSQPKSPRHSRHGSRHGSHHGSRHGSRHRSRSRGRHGSRHGSRSGSRHGSPRRSRPKSRSGSRHGSRHGSRSRSRSGSRGSPNEYGIIPVTFIPDITVDHVDQGRCLGLPQCPIIFVMGGPGSGRNTQCKKIAGKADGFVHLAMGEILRHEIAEKGTADDKWAMAGQLVQKGELAPHEMTSLLLVERISSLTDAKCIVIESFPKNVQQIAEFNKLVGGMNLAVILDVEEITMIRRLLERGHLNDRGDDNINAIKHRIKNFKDNILPLVKYYDDIGQLSIIDGDRDVDAVYADLESTVNSVIADCASATNANLSLVSDPAYQVGGVAGLGDTITSAGEVDIEVDDGDKVADEDQMNEQTDGKQEESEEQISEAAVSGKPDGNDEEMINNEQNNDTVQEEEIVNENKDEEVTEDIETEGANEGGQELIEEVIESGQTLEEGEAIEETAEGGQILEAGVATEEAAESGQIVEEGNATEEAAEAGQDLGDGQEATEVTDNVEATETEQTVEGEENGQASEDTQEIDGGNAEADDDGQQTEGAEIDSTEVDEGGDGTAEGQEGGDAVSEVVEGGQDTTESQEVDTVGEEGATEVAEGGEAETGGVTQSEEGATEGGEGTPEGGGAGSGQENNQTNSGEVEDAIVAEHFEPLG
ncbi:adenylate kinase isoenzyme 5-like [Tubulanus polymorphus]|uniref:adenylate kinase isoenzyme 5-like n=1 Tax=Tubulanus polymorphus TaxID=672921 RepID=UPI003DA4C601